MVAKWFLSLSREMDFFHKICGIEWNCHIYLSRHLNDVAILELSTAVSSPPPSDPVATQAEEILFSYYLCQHSSYTFSASYWGFQKSKLFLLILLWIEGERCLLKWKGYDALRREWYIWSSEVRLNNTWIAPQVLRLLTSKHPKKFFELAQMYGSGHDRSRTSHKTPMPHMI